MYVCMYVCVSLTDTQRETQSVSASVSISVPYGSTNQQANIRIMEVVADRLGIPMEKVPIPIPFVGFRV
jgi:hypothetical protein